MSPHILCLICSMILQSLMLSVASTSDGRRSAAEIEFSSMKQPPLIKQLKGILSEYPDGGQILKEVIQNAEDAEASEVQIVYNGRRINDTTGETTPAYNRFFKGPSLCIYNDAVFTEKDWDGIRMIYSSVKEDDPLTVGRFGLGFKSVFHITDYPCVISGGKMLLIDPQQSSDKVNAMVNLDEIDQLEHRGLNAESFWLALDGMFGFNRECAQRGYFKGTIFWFPLREKKSEISETLYDEAKILDLFEGFQTEASSILLFLKHLQRVSVSSIGADNQLKEITKAEVDDSTGKLKQSRAKFKEKIKLLSNDYKGEDITVDLHMTIRTTINGICECAQWQVVNYFVGNSASSDFKRLIQDEDLGYSPYIGVASPLNEQNGRFEGHVFCFLPLPREGTRLTGLPVHVNGFFALSQNRHHLKWETDEQKGKKIDDKSILWNKYLIKEALPKAYSRLVQCVVDVSNSIGNTDDSIAAVYKCLPLASSIENKWKVLETELYKKIKKLRVLYSKHKSKWVTLADASFASFDNLPEDHKHVKNAVIRCLSLIGKLHIEMPFEVLQNLQKHFQAIKDLTPDALAKQLRQNAAYKNLSNADKLEALTYMCSDGRYYQKVEGLELLPLASGGWTSFRTQGEPVYACTDEEVEILNGLEKRMIIKPSSLGTPLSCHMDQICSNGVFQVKKLTASDLGQLLEITITNQLGANPRITQSSKLSFAWLQNTWKYIIESNVVPYMKNVPLVPVLTAGTWDSPESADLIFVSDMILVKSSDKEELAQGLCRCFENMGVKVVGALPKWIPRENIKSFFHWPSKKSIIALLTKLGTMENANETAEMFNTRTKWKDKSVLAACLAKCHTNLTEEAIDFTKTLKIFHAITSMEDAGTDTALSETNVYVNDEEQFPEGVRFPSRYISTESSKEGLLSTLGARKIELEELVIATLNGFQKEGHKNVNEIPKFMDYFINKFHLFQTNDTIINAASNIPFLRAGNQRCKASDLFDPSDSNLQELLIGDALLPETKKRLSNEKVRILKFLGLKGADKITADIILQVAKTLDAWSRDSHNHTQCVKKANSLLNCLHFRESLLDEKCKNGLTLSKCLTSLSCIPVQNSRVPPYPDCVQWFSEDIHLCKPSEAKETCMSLLIGATKPIVACTSDKINTGFGWKLPPAVTDVILQLESVSKSYSVQNRPDIMPMIKAIYGHLSQRHREIWQNKQTFARSKLIWNGTGFVTVNEVITLKQSDNLDLYPYFCFVPAEFQSMERLFTSFGCRLEQNIQVLIETLQQIRKVHSTSQEAHTVVRDRNIVCNILDRIALNYKQHLTATESEILMMVHDSNPNCLRLFPLSECTYDDDPTCFFEDDENVHLVHEMVSPNTVEALGVKSITRKALMEAEELGVEEWGQQEPLTTRIHALLRDGYTDGLSVPKELIQNADDAGASVVKFLYDERQNNDVKQRVFSKGMRSFQGPALWIFNDARFSADDMKNITKLNAATKQADIRKIGKFGLGFCSVYNLTDLPSFLSGSNLVFFDPHEKHLGNVLRSRGTGLRYQLPNKTLVSRHVDQFRPYSGIFGCNIEQDDFKEYDGTLFRLPLRTEQQARESRISSVSYTNDEMVTLLRMFIKAAGNFLLFTQNVRKIEIYHLCESATTASEQRLLHIIERNSVKWDQGVTGPANANVLARMPEVLQTTCEFQEIHKSVICQTLTEHAKSTIPELDVTTDDIESTWIISWAKGDGKSVQMCKSLSSEGAVPLSAVAVPCTESNVLTLMDLQKVSRGFYQEGHVFCFLPLPLKTKLQLHINGCFSVTSDRRQLASLTEDDKDSRGNTWNVALMEDSLVKAFLHLIQALANTNMKVSSCYNYYDLWPAMCAPIVLPFQESFYKAIIEKNVKVFKGCQTWVSFQNAIFLDQKIHGSDVGGVAFEMLSNFPPRQGKTLIEMPKQVFENIKQCNIGRESRILAAQIGEREFYLTFLKTLFSEFWNNRLEERNKLIVAALKCHSDEVKKEMQNIKCIPTEPKNVLAKASDLIHPGSTVASLFSDSEEIFPLSTKEFRKESTLAKLVDLGMNTAFLPSALLINRCESVSALARNCGTCANERFANLMSYLSHDTVVRELEKDKRTVGIVTEQFMFPILSKPIGWKFSWKAESDSTQVKIYSGNNSCKTHKSAKGKFAFGKSKNLYRQSTADYAGIVGYIVDESYTFPLKEYRKSSEKVLELFGIKSLQEIPMEILSQQIKSLSEQYNDKKEQFEDVSRIHDKIFKYIEKKIDSSKINDSDKRSLDILRQSRFVLIGDELLYAQNVAFNVKEEFKPQLYRLPEIDKLNKSTIYSYLGVQQYFSVDVIVNIMQSIQRPDEQVENVEAMNNLLINLDEIMQYDGRPYEELAEFHELIIAPDMNCMLWPTYQLVVENEEYKTSSSMKILHSSITPAVAKRLGAKVKKLRCYQEISIGVSFGQREELVTRIKGILKAYPCDSSIMKELLQNADDAGATEIHFVKDYRNHSTEKLFQSSCEVLQGPSLCVYNNSYFTKKDIEGIHNLGQGSKSDDPTKTGQYGVGFNAVYHLTDTPSFVTIGPGDANGGLMFILDPLCKHVPQATPDEPGMMCTLADLETNFSDHMLGFSIRELIKGGIGTVFRLPLRKTSSGISEEEIITSKLDEILHSFEAEMFESVLFLKNISSIKVSDITSGKLVEEYSVQVHLSETASKDRKAFKEEVDKINKENIKCREKHLDREAKEVIYEMNVKDTRNKSKHWVIIQRFGIYGAVDHLDEIRDNLKSGDLGLLPSGGVAIQLNCNLVANISPGETHYPTNPSQSDPEGQSKAEVTRSMTLNGRAFCFLPLPIFTGLPVHINGHFALDHEARRDLWKDGYRMKWNKCILNAVIIPAWISGLLYLCNSITPVLQNANVWHTVNTILADYHSIFPTGSCTSDTWNELANYFYTYALREHVKLFPCILDNKSELASFSTSSKRFVTCWTKVNATKETGIYGVFKTVPDEPLKTYNVLMTHKDALLIIQLLKAFGMKLLETPNKVRLAMVKAGFENVPVASPALVISFLKTFTDDSDWKCDVGPVGSLISETKYITPNNLNVLLDFVLQEKDCYKNITGLPVLLTGDGILRVSSDDSEVFISKFSKLLLKSAHMFVHDKILFALRDPKLFETNIFKRFQFEDFVRLLPNTMDVKVFRNGSKIMLEEGGKIEDQNSPTVISQEWLTLFYDFLCESSIQTSSQEKPAPQNSLVLSQTDRKIDTEILRANIILLNEWSLLPCVDSDDRHVLIPMKETCHLLFLSVLDKMEKTGQALKKFQLPKLNANAFSKCHAKDDIRKSMENIVASLRRPYDLLRCLVHHKDKLKTSDTKTEEDGIEILALFGRNMELLKEFALKDTLVALLRQLPLYLTQQSTMTDLATTQEVLVLPKGMPFSGIQAWADSCNITLLQEKESLETIYEFLGLQKADEDYVYGQKILPTFNAIPSQHWMEHIEYLRDKLGHRSNLTTNQSKIIQELKKIAFIDVNGIMKRANQLFDQSNTTFKHLVNTKECLPNDMLTSEWTQFLQKLDLKCDVTDEMLVMFARQIESESTKVSVECLRNKSKILLGRFVERGGQDWRITTLAQIRTVKFIEPFVITDECKDVCAQYCENDGFICFNDAISSDYSDLCWTSVNLLPSKQFHKLNNGVRKQLGILEKPPVDKIIQHCICVCDSLKIKLSRGTVSDSFVKNQMSCFYEFFSNYPSLSDQCISKLRGEPFIHLPEEKDIVMVSKVVVDLSSALEIKPYLYKAPTYYGKYHDLFQKIGSKKSIMFCHYASVLQTIKDECKEEEMSVPERAVVRRAFRGLVKLAPDKDTSTKDLHSVFLPTQKMFLKDSKQVIVSNNVLFELRLKGNIELDMCAGESFIDVKQISLEEVILKWPAHLKPLLLTDVIKEEVCIEAALNQKIRNSRKASKIEAFLHSHELVTGLCRLIKHQSTMETSENTFNAERTETEIANNLQNVIVVELPALKTVLKYQGRTVSGSERDINCYFDNENGNLSHPMTFYFKDKNKTEKVDIPSILHGIISLLKMCASGLNAESIIHVSLLIQSLEAPHKIHEVLDHLHMKPYGSPQTTTQDYFPQPGTYVEPQFIPFLEQSISPFKDFEYDHVAMELEDTSLEKDEDGGQNSVFIYVKILQEVVDPDTGNNDLRRVYIVETGNTDIPTEKVPIYRLYRFIRKETCLSKNLEVYTGKQSEQQLPPLDDQCKKIREELKQAWNLPEEDRKRVVRRILLKWHPDKNRGNEEYCTKVFQYIQIILSRLENDERLDDDVEEEMKRGKSQFSQSSSAFYENVFRRARSYARAYYDNFDAYNRSERTGDYAHSTSTDIKRQDHGEAQRWFRQAKSDYLAASEMYPTASGTSSFNWVCYICHQACEKALKAAHYSRDANKVPEGIFLPTLAITPEMVQQATLLENRLGAHGRLRYPDVLSRPRIPSDMFSKEDAEFALLIAKTILELVEEYI